MVIVRALQPIECGYRLHLYMFWVCQITILIFIATREYRA